MRRLCELVLLLVALSIASHADSTDLQQYLRDHYQGRTFVLRSFSAGDHLVYNSSGELTKGASSDDWTSNGFVSVSHAQLSRGRASIEAMRLLVVVEDKEFRLRPAIHPGPPNRDQKPVMVKIEAELGVNDPSPEQVDRALSKIFLTLARQLVRIGCRLLEALRSTSSRRERQVLPLLAGDHGSTRNSSSRRKQCRSFSSSFLGFFAIRTCSQHD